MEHKIFLTDLHEYNNGRLVGDWVDITDFNRDEHNFNEICKRCGIGEGNEFFITDYESSFDIDADAAMVIAGLPTPNSVA